MDKNKKEQEIFGQLEGKPVVNIKTKKRANVPFEFKSIIILFIELTIAMLVGALINGIIYGLYFAYHFKFVVYLVCLFIFNYVLSLANTRAKFHVYSSVILFYANLCIVLSCAFDYFWTHPGAYAFLGYLHMSLMEIMGLYMLIYLRFWGIGHLVLFLVFLVIEFARCKKGALRMKF